METINDLKQDFIPTNGIYILNANEAFTAPLRRYLTAISEEANKIASTLLTRCTTKQLECLISGSWSALFYSQQNNTYDLTISGITKNNMGLWLIDFQSHPLGFETYLLSDLGLDDKLILIDLIENVLLNS